MSKADEKAVLVEAPKVSRLEVVHKTVGDLLQEFPHSPNSLAASLTDYLNAQSTRVLVGSWGDTTNLYFAFKGV